MRKDDVREMLDYVKDNNNNMKLHQLRIERLEFLLDKLDNKDEKHTEEVKKEIKYMLYNNRDKITNK